MTCSRGVRPTMNCEILRTLYLRSNGDVPCNDDAGENKLLGLVRPRAEPWPADALLGNHRYRHIRESLRAGVPPWPDICPGCAFFRPHEPLHDGLAERRIRKIQVEPTLACRLKCPGCSNRLQVQVRPQPLRMDPALFGQVLRGLADGGYAVQEIEYCGQGEPLAHPEFPAFVALARRLFPAAHQRLITSGNFAYADTAGVEPPDEIMVSCDGAFAESYARYRVGGRIEDVLRFLREAQAESGPRRPIVIWKYILFEWNDSPEEILAAQRLADEIGVRYLLFVLTHSAGKSRRYTLETIGDLPRVSRRVVANATPEHYRDTADPLGAAAAGPAAA